MDIVFQLNELPSVAATVWNQYRQYKTWLFEAGMGAGKTTFIHALCEWLQVKDAISSPTFAIVNEYRSPVAGTIYHMDWYRLKNEEEAIQAGVEDSLFSGNLCLVEWPEIAKGLLPENTLNIYIEAINSSLRRLYTT